MKTKVFFLFLTLLVSIHLKAQSPVKKYGRLKVDGIYLKGENNENVVLRGVTYGWSNEHFRFYNRKSVQWIVDDWKATVVRTAIGIEPVDGYLEKPLFTTDYVEEVIKGAIENDVYVIIAWHCNNMHLKQSKDFFSKIAQDYGKFPNIIYEIYTEPDDEKWIDLKSYYAEIINTIRIYDPNNIILLSAPYWTQHIREVADEPLTSFSNIMYTIHFCIGENNETLKNDCNYALSKGIPLMVSDYLGTDCSCNSKLFYSDWEQWISWFDRNKISWMAWSISDKAEKCSMLLPSASSEGKWKDSDLSESGAYVKKLLRRYNNIK